MHRSPFALMAEAVTMQILISGHSSKTIGRCEGGVQT
jgi:hypothetical protein